MKLKRFGDFLNEAEQKGKEKTDAKKEKTDPKIEAFMKRFDDAVKKKDMDEDKAAKIRRKLRAEIDRKGIDKIEQELKKKDAEEEKLKSGEYDKEGEGKLKGVKRAIKREVWKGYKTDVNPFWDTVSDLLSV